jgi:hypothetical protein
LGKTIQLNEKLVESLPKILLVFGATLATNCVQLVDKDDSGLLVSGSCEEFTYPLCAWKGQSVPFRSRQSSRRRILTNTHEDFVEFRP